MTQTGPRPHGSTLLDSAADATHVEQRLNHLGAALVFGFFSASRTIRIHAMDNRATQAALQRLMDTIHELARMDGRITLSVVTDLLEINEMRLVVDSQHVQPVLFLLEEMKKRGVEEIDITPDVTIDEIGAFVRIFFSDPPADDAFGALTRQMADSGVSHIRLTEWIERVKTLRDTRIDKKSVQEESNKVMSRAVLFVGELMRAVEQKHPIQVTKALRLTQKMADIIQVDESVLVGLTSIKDYDEYTFAHSVNVSVLSMVIADRLRLAKSEVAEIGVAGLLHDIGKMHVPLPILNKPEQLDAGEWETMRRHPMLGVIELSRVRSLRMITSPLFVALEHHVQYGGRGYPVKPGGWDVHPYSRIVSVADVYDAMTTARNYRVRPLSPGQALRFIHGSSGNVFDPVVVKAFIRAMGIHPVGSAVQLDTGDAAVVVRQNADPQHLHRPFVMLMNADGPYGAALDLAERKGDVYRHRIVGGADDLVRPCHRADCFVTR